MAPGLVTPPNPFANVRLLIMRLPSLTVIGAKMPATESMVALLPEICRSFVIVGSAEVIR
jgi:hypothetical protein